ncbi:MAG: YhjD/YihY/BrkB family envelope integrity protein, partial [Deltaproteobacteria bacterium]
LWLGGAFGFSFYANHFGNFNATYGSIGTVIVLLTWLYLTGFVLALGGQINAVLAVIDPEGAP